ncbi:zinc-dependent metalloprotease [Flavobacterium capsici]|uniref:Zinc-dependent metalloprotease family protein n=1 Tax=Flavobacterium capsici TaxID=3075618 RepID=A0AA96J7G8_9FLAO|nr:MULTISPECIES: zinc-dependent metalloprotease family protein [unclassified Flavobacterium]WNM19927.1 zinc-dependent metalloprotease family protein [Flavobacterium sp. PMR2A8]WNM21316.1 zinc-dependent metalloprotease family protein [Flavobacterium sp. PMTSA4]
MRIKLLIIALFLCFSSFSQKDIWKKNESREITPNKFVQRNSFPDNFTLYQVAANELKNLLQQSPNRLTTSSSKVVISVPNSNGDIERFQMFEFSNFDPQLQAQFPEIRSYIGKGIDDKTAIIRMSSDPSGFQGIIFRADKGTEFFEPYSQDSSVYAFFTSADRKRGNLPFVCSTEDVKLNNELKESLNSQNRSSSGQLLNFRLALSCNGEYAIYFGGTVNGALAAMNATMTRVNGVFEKDLAIHMNLIANNSLVVYTNPNTDPYSTNIGAWNGQLQTTLTNVIGEANYDIGHMFGSTGGGGSAGCIGCVCVNGVKGSGKTSPADGVPMGDNFDIDYVAHEMGHQFGGNHTFSNSVEGSGVNVEPGSGSTIMGYAGITAQDVQPHSDAYFIYANIKQIQDNMVAKTCPQRINLTNITPEVDAGFDYTIPKSTPFVLTGTAYDGNGDTMTYCWEQNDSAITTTPSQTGTNSGASATKLGGPNWRSYNPTTSPSRYFPRIQSIIANQSTTAGSEINVEALSSVARTLNFVFTARDNYAGAGQTNSDAMVVTVNATAGPFLVSSPNTAVSWTVGSNQTVTWDVAGTTSNNVNAAYVDIFLSTDGGFTYPILLASKVPNDGSETITVPNNVGTANRIMVKGYKHIFFDISNANFTITAPTSSFAIAFNGIAEQQNKEACTGATIDYTIPYSAYAGFSGTTTFSVSGQPAGSVVTFTPNTMTSSGNVTMTISNTNNLTAAFYNLTVTATDGVTSKTVPFYLNLLNSTFNNLILTSPANQAIGQNSALNLTWQADSNATLYDVQVSTDPNFSTISYSGTVATNSFALNNLSSATQYYWRVLPKNSSCFGNYSQVYLFKTGQITCTNYNSTNVPITIPTTANVTVNSTLSVPDTDVISDVNVTLNISHTYVNDLTITLISPAGTQVKLVQRPCADAELENITATFDDSGIPLVCQVSPAISGVVIPLETLTAFNGQTMNGIWTLRVFDQFNLDGGAINGWTLNLCKNTAVPLEVNENSLQNFSLYPNPNNGNFNISFNSNSTNKINVGVFDIRGRSVFSNDYQNNGFFNETINLSNIQSGIYLVKVQDGEKQITKKIVVE